MVRTLDLRLNGREVDATNTAMSERGGTASEYQLHDCPAYNVPSVNRQWSRCQCRTVTKTS